MAEFAWRTFLGQFISDPQQLTIAAQHLHVGERSIKRWVANENSPRLSMLGEIVLLFPDQERPHMVMLLRQEFPDFALAETPKQVSVSFEEKKLSPELYDEILYARLHTSPTKWFVVVSHLILRPMLDELDPYNHGMSIGISQCQDDGEKIVALRDRVEFGTLPWTTNFTPAKLVGQESLAGYALLKGELQIIQDVTASQLLPVRDVLFAKSTASIPIMGSPDSVAGCVTIHSGRPNYFSSDRLSLILKYVRLISLAFSDAHFYPSDHISLQTMPDDDVQQGLYLTFRRRVTSIINTREIGYEEAEKLVWSQFAKEESQMSSPL